MARGRMLNKKISKSIQFNALPDDTCRLLATWIIAHLDKNGVFTAEPVLVKSDVFPWRSDITIEQVEHCLTAMEQNGLIVIFWAKGMKWQYWPGFTENQIGLRADRESTDCPEPPLLPTCEQEPEDSQPDESSSAEVIRQPSGNLPESIPPNLKESKDKEKEKGNGGAEAQPPADKPPKETKPKTARPDVIPAFKAYVDITGYHAITKHWRDKMAEAVGAEPENVAFWGKVVEAWTGKGWFKGNIEGMLEFYSRRVLPGEDKKNGNFAKTGPNGNTPPLTEEQRQALAYRAAHPDA